MTQIDFTKLPFNASDLADALEAAREQVQASVEIEAINGTITIATRAGPRMVHITDLLWMTESMLRGRAISWKPSAQAVMYFDPPETP